MRSRIVNSLILLVTVLPCFASNDAFYLGEKACRECHDRTGDTSFTQWRLSGHATAYASLARPESLDIAFLSGIEEDPQESPICLGCHSTASDALDWQVDPGFHPEDGLQCEACHGPGSQHVEEGTSLRRPDESFCMICHREKQSHVRILGPKPFNFKEFWGRIGHSRENNLSPEKEAHAEPEAMVNSDYVGMQACLKCHLEGMSKPDSESATAGTKDQSPLIKVIVPFATWRESAHARSMADLNSGHSCKVTGNKLQGDRASCLPCHATPGSGDSSQDIEQGVQCESCHGPGNSYLAQTDFEKGLKEHGPTSKVSASTCKICHRESGFDFIKAKAKISHVWKKKRSERDTVYKTPQNLVLTGDSSKLLVACEASGSVIVLDAQQGNIIKEIKVGRLPHDVCVSPDDSMAFVSNRGSDSVSVVDLKTMEVTDTWQVGDEPHGLITDAAGTLLYVVNGGNSDVSVIDLKTGKEIKRLAAARGAWGIQRSADGSKMMVTHNLSHLVKFREPCVSEAIEIDTSQNYVSKRHMIPEANMVEGVAFSPDNRFAIVTLIRTKNLVPITRVMQGWVMTNGFAVIWNDGRVDQLLLDEYDNYFADPTDVAIIPNGKYAYVTGGGINAVAVIDLKAMTSILENATDRERREVLPNHLGVVSEFVLKRIPVGLSPRGLCVSPDGKFVYVANGLSDSISVIDTTQQKVVRTLSLDGPDYLTLQRKGEQIFHSAEVTYGHEFSCHSCHPDGGVDGITYDIEPDGLGLNPVDNRSLKGILDTAPFKWTGKNATLRRQCGPRLAVFFTRIDPFTPEQVEALDHYICTIPRNPNRYRVQGQRTPAQERGKQLFERDTDNSGKPIPAKDRCITCHPPPYFTARHMADTVVKSELDTHSNFDIPHLTNIYESAPYLHDGRADTLEEIWTRYNPDDTHGVTNDMTKDQLKDLIEYLRTL